MTVDVLAIGAHPDDVEIGCAGALILAADAGLSVAVADLTRGERGTAGTPAQRLDERRRASELLGLAQRVDVGLPDGAVGGDASHRGQVAAVLGDLRPRIVLAPAETDRHPDHAAAGRLAREACFEATLGHGHRVGRLYHYAIHHPIEPAFVLDVSTVWERRMAALTAYTTQFGHPPGEWTTPIGSPAFLEFVEARAAYFGALIGVRRGEPFAAAGPLAARMLPGLQDPADGAPPAYRVHV